MSSSDWMSNSEYSLGPLSSNRDVRMTKDPLGPEKRRLIEDHKSGLLTVDELQIELKMLKEGLH